MGLTYQSYSEMPDCLSNSDDVCREDRLALASLDKAVAALERLKTAPPEPSDLLRIVTFWKESGEILSNVTGFMSLMEHDCGNTSIEDSEGKLTPALWFAEEVFNNAAALVVNECEQRGLDANSVEDASLIIWTAWKSPWDSRFHVVLDAQEAGDISTEFVDKMAEAIYNMIYDGRLSTTPDEIKQVLVEHLSQSSMRSPGYAVGGNNDDLTAKEHRTLAAAARTIHQLEDALRAEQDRARPKLGTEGTATTASAVQLIDHAPLDDDYPWLEGAHFVLRAKMYGRWTSDQLRRIVRYWRQYPSLVSRLHSQDSKIPDHLFAVSLETASLAVEFARLIIMQSCEAYGIDSGPIANTDEIRARYIEKRVLVCIGEHWLEYPRFRATNADDDSPVTLTEPETVTLSSAVATLARLHAKLDANDGHGDAAVASAPLDNPREQPDTRSTGQPVKPKEPVRVSIDPMTQQALSDWLLQQGAKTCSTETIRQAAKDAGIKERTGHSQPYTADEIRAILSIMARKQSKLGQVCKTVLGITTK